MRRRYLYERFQRDTTYESEHASFTSFLSSAISDTVATYVDQRNDLADILSMPSSTSTELEYYQDDYKVHLDSLNSFDALNNDTLTVAELNDRNDIIVDMQDDLDRMDSMRADWIDTVEAELSSWLVEWNNTYTPDTLYSNEQEVVEMYVNILLDSTLTSSDSTDLVDIVSQCPLNGGPAVYYAQTLLKSEFDTSYSLGTCNINNSKIKTQRPLESIKVYPNPVRNVLHIQGVTKGQQVFIFDRLGRIVDRVMMNENTLRYNTSDLAPGVYWLRSESKTAKFIRIR